MSDKDNDNGNFPFVVVVEYRSSFLSLDPSRIQNAIEAAMDPFFYPEGFSVRTVPNPDRKPLPELLAETS